MSKTTSKKNELFNGFFLIFLGVWIWWYTASFPTLDDDYPGPALFPRIIALGFLLCGSILLFASLFNRPDSLVKWGNKPHSETAFSIRQALFLVGGMTLIFLFPIITTQLHFIVALGLICFAFGLLLKVVWWKAGLTALLTSVFIYLVFIQLLGVSL